MNSVIDSIMIYNRVSDLMNKAAESCMQDIGKRQAIQNPNCIYLDIHTDSKAHRNRHDRPSISPGNNIQSMVTIQVNFAHASAG